MKQTEWDNIPECAIYALEYGTEEDGSLNALLVEWFGEGVTTY